ncbi:hypothetical protein AL542_10765 [Grimontia hollisae]|uniref:Uncharacterized protein n=1 Tax=Grimontia hollisae CIP 101886 TaxID=675812 RepID=D0I3G1_GRIHO|nr:hypothetical protein [Grimontia hollisae]AMG30794.1 hypothetical protein AL542_10765 [Grimontia hollisae]EEY73982.1 hypothetical protein VHA_000274 [Grimontia hollisae CIP 101886]STO47393.1 Uncharacterised protein [Grimontia hollisae]
MSNAVALTSTPHNLKQFEAMVEEAANAPVPAAESIAAAKALFTSGYKQSQIAMVYNGLDERARGIILLTGRADHNLRDKNFNELDDLTREKIRRGLTEFSGVIRRFNNAVGHIEKTLPSDFR